MKLEFNIEKRTAIDLPILLEKTLSKLKVLDYNDINDSNNVITFEYSGWGLRSNGKNAYKVGKGTIEIYSLKNENVIKLIYNKSVTIQVIIVLILSIIGLFITPVLFPMIFIFVISIIDIYGTKLAAEKMIDEIIN